MRPRLSQPWGRGLGLEPGFTVDEVGLARVLGEDCLKGSDDSPGAGPGAAVASGNEDHAEMTVAAGHDRLIVQRAVVAQVVGHDRAVLGPGQHEDLWI